MKDRTVVITGANRGLGLAITRGLARLGARIVMACRSEERARKALWEACEALVSGP